MFFLNVLFISFVTNLEEKGRGEVQLDANLCGPEELSLIIFTHFLK